MSVSKTQETEQHRRHPPPLPPPVSDGSGVTPTASGPSSNAATASSCA